MSADKLAQALKAGIEAAQELLAIKREALGDDYTKTRSYWETERELVAALAAHQAEHPTDQDWNRLHHVLKKHGLHPGRTDDNIVDVIDAALSEQPAHVPGHVLVPLEVLQNAAEDANESLCRHLIECGTRHKIQRGEYYREQVRILESLLAAAPQQGGKTAADACIQGLRNVIAEDTKEGVSK